MPVQVAMGYSSLPGLGMDTAAWPFLVTTALSCFRHLRWGTEEGSGLLTAPLCAQGTVQLAVF